MADLLVKLYELPAADASGVEGVTVRRAMSYERHIVVEWVRTTFGEAWASECEIAFGNRPISCYIATRQGELLGFACYDATARGLFGPIGVAEAVRGCGIGRMLLLHTLHAMSVVGYAYAIVGGAGDVSFYVRTVEAAEIPGSAPGLYRDRLKSAPL